MSNIENLSEYRKSHPERVGVSRFDQLIDDTKTRVQKVKKPNVVRSEGFNVITPELIRIPSEYLDLHVFAYDGDRRFANLRARGLGVYLEIIGEGADVDVQLYVIEDIWTHDPQGTRVIMPEYHDVILDALRRAISPRLQYTHDYPVANLGLRHQDQANLQGAFIQRLLGS